MNEDRLKAFASVIFDDAFVVRNMKIVEGNHGVFLCMPSRKMVDGTHKDMVHPINQEFRTYLESHILKAYKEELAKQKGNSSANSHVNCESSSEAHS